MSRKRKNRKPTWLLTIASAYSVLPGCGDDSPEANASVQRDGGRELDAGVMIRPGVIAVDGGILISPPDAGLAIEPPHDAGTHAALDSGLTVGLIIKSSGESGE